ncbi:N-acetyl neuraminic (sialic) acid synthetase [Leptospira langatensis]|uniref:N-acetyl neuraminic (Sialic) acid synthetase n=1 Tax=Leptospira langatensis TaxID=2484983 RepID=A0A5F1ZRB6_9LEPT|nr:N-acetylneuraminate synthase family protein [Leptospira langatensis]TGK05444.1 N-acetyl neuraminic (sialic) acid synthetase [Leptospira langatensis]TGL38580.1 N-acetyl neuraminic (sialic) acid synthetase [Leptospira langatensis]
MTFAKSFRLGDTWDLGPDSSPFLIAEIGLNHNADLELGKRTIQAAKSSGASAVKFQSYITENFLDVKNPKAKVLLDIFKQYELSEKLHREFKSTAESEGLFFFSTPLDVTSVDLLVSIGVKALKIASGDIVNKQLLDKCADAKLPLLLSSGAAEGFEVVRALEFLGSKEVKELLLFHCVSLYPTPPEKANLQTIRYYQNIFSGPVGFSDHTAGSLAGALAVSLGASALEKHFTLDKKLPGPDHTISADPDEFKVYAENARIAFQMRGEEGKLVQPQEASGRFFGRRGLYADANRRPIALRPDLSQEDPSYLDSWKLEEAEAILKNNKGPKPGDAFQS